MGTILTGYGGASYDHEGFAAQVLTDGSITGTYSAETEARMIGQVVAACDCGWTGTTRYPTATGPFDEQARELALNEWEHSHARPVLEHDERGRGSRLWELARRGEAHCAELGVTGSRPYSDRVELLDCILRVLGEATELARELREQPTPVERAGGSR